MYGLISTIIVCGTILYWSHRYLTPYRAPEVETKIQDVDNNEDKDAPTFDRIIAAVYDRLDEEE